VLILVSTRRVPSRRTSAWLLLTPLTSAVLATTLLGETPTPLELVGGTLVIAGILGASGASDGILRGLTGRRTRTTRGA
jgi:drug/metabolite transporter (DMT)-like permease